MSREVAAPDTLAGYSQFTLGAVEAATAESPIWFRGTGRLSYKLQPGFYRRRTAIPANPPAWRKLEKELLAYVEMRGVPFFPSPPVDQLERLFVLQHQGIPTRLLDWTESPLVALYFALSGLHRDDDGKVLEDAAVWALRPLDWNARFGVDRILPRGDSYLKRFATDDDSGDYPDRTLCLYGPHNSARITAQRGVFTIAGSRIDGMEVIADAEGIAEATLSYFRIPANTADLMMSALTRVGYSDSVVFPDVEGFSREVRRRFEYHV